MKVEDFIGFIPCYIQLILFLLLLSFLLKLVLLEWSESKSDCKIGFSMLKNPHLQIFGAIGATSGV